MPAQYYYAMISDNPDDAFRLDDIESMRDFLIKNPEVSELFHTDLSGIKIEYDTKTGAVGIASKEESQNVKNSFRREAFEKKISEVEKAIGRFAKHQLLYGISQLNDPAIMGIIKEYELHFDGHTPNNSVAVDKALNKMMKVIMPKPEGILARGMRLFSAHEKPIDKSSTQSAIYQALEKLGVYENGIDSVKSIGQVTKIMKTIKTNLVENKATLQVYPSSPLNRK